MTQPQRLELLAYRKRQKLPWHSPLHCQSNRTNSYLFTAACFNHAPVIGHSWERMTAFEQTLLQVAQKTGSTIIAWVILPNHYHFLAAESDCLAVLKALGQLHGRTSFQWNGEEQKCGRQVWYNAIETVMKSDRHFWATLNYVHHNPVKHGYVNRWQDWPFSSASTYLEAAGRTEAERVWLEYPIGDYGKAWDEI